MLIRATIKQSFTNLRSYKMRSFLTMLGIIIGISSVITITSVVAGAESLITNQIRGIGSNIIGILPGKSDENGPPAAVFGVIITTLKDSDTEAIKKEIPNITAACSYVSATETATWENQKVVAPIYGVSADYPLIADSKLESGEFFTEENKKTNATVAVIGSQIKEDLFGNTNPLGQKINIKQNSFNVIGVMKPQGTSGFQNVDNMIFVPVTTAQNRILGIKHIGFMRLKIDNELDTQYVITEVENILRNRHNIDNPAKDDFSVRSTDDAQKMLGTITGSLQFFLLAIVSISLIVGGIGIMNIMLAAVTQRVKEIGLRKSVGAKSKQIIYQFLLETLVITTLGAVIGIIIGILLSYLISLIVNKLGYDWTFVITLSSIVLACIMSSSIGLIFGLYPARKAASLDPISALHYE
ncbi:MAG: hypothetical protein UT02_C0012G0008 [Parcubacteria group bacterium GW2011_GWC2_38_7]|nr:MAG: hypothetical protein UT02_C0012G0008 [Parcubacteria group bacterium GW2011_GWC2_38_7]